MRKKIFDLAKSPWMIAAVALALRVAYVAYMAHLIPTAVLAAVPFQNEVGNVAAAVAHGDGFCCLFRQPTGPTAWLSPVYPLLVAAIFKCFGTFTLKSFYAAVSLNCISSALATVPLFYGAKRITGSATAALAGWIWAIFPAGIMLPFEWIWDTSLSVLLAAALLWATVKLKSDPCWQDCGWYGLLWGVSLLTNPTLGAVLPFLLGWLIYQRRGNLPQQIRLARVTLGAALLVCAPWTIRNAVQFHRLIPLRSNFPYEFWSGNNEIFDQHSREVNRITRYEQVHLYAELGENEFLEEKTQSALQFVHTHPALYTRLFAQRIVATWLGTASPIEDFQRTDSLLVRFLLSWNAFALIGAAAGMVRLYRKGRAYFLPVVAYPLFFPLAFYIAHTTLRHRHPCDPIVALLIAIAVTGVAARDEAELV
jgi:Dolichyl-phosphate-mannose-protein mannosyltransferase